MTHVAVSIAVTSAESLDDAVQMCNAAKHSGADLVEWRLDTLDDPTEIPEAANQLCRLSPLPCIVTIRSMDEGGAWDGNATLRTELIEGVASGASRPAYVDIEAATRGSIPTADLTGETRIILSSHDPQGRPADLLNRVLRMWEEPRCAIAKIVWRARSVRDNLEAFEILSQRQKPTIALCLGEFGLMSRVLAPKFGGFLTFVRATSEGTAPGQPSTDELTGCYRFREIGEATRVYGVVGYPISHSRSPITHNAWFAAVGHDGVMLPIPVPPEWENFKATLGAMIDSPILDFAGCAVTLPHKEHLVRFIGERGGALDAVSELCGAANTLVVAADRSLHGFNTDAPACVQLLQECMQSSQSGDASLEGRTVCIVGAGGVARAVAAGLLCAGVRVMIHNRTPERAHALVESLRESLVMRGSACVPVHGDLRQRISCHPISEIGRTPMDALINATPVGMSTGPEPEGMPCALPESLAGVVVLDTVYTPERTPLVRAAQARGAVVISGEAMFQHQARAQFRLWTGRDAPPNKHKVSP